MNEKLEHGCSGGPLVYSSIANITVDVATDRSHHTNTAQNFSLNIATVSCNHRQVFLLQNFIAEVKRVKKLAKNSVKRMHF